MLEPQKTDRDTRMLQLQTEGLKHAGIAQKLRDEGYQTPHQKRISNLFVRSRLYRLKNNVAVKSTAVVPVPPKLVLPLDARLLALKAENKTLPEIAVILQTEGYKTKTDKPITKGWVGSHLGWLSIKGKKKAPRVSRYIKKKDRAMITIPLSEPETARTKSKMIAMIGDYEDMVRMTKEWMSHEG